MAIVGMSYFIGLFKFDRKLIWEFCYRVFLFFLFFFRFLIWQIFVLIVRFIGLCGLGFVKEAVFV